MSNERECPMKVRVLHCWEDGPVTDELDENGYPIGQIGSTCMLEAGHEGPHDFIPDSNIGISFQ